MAADNMDDDATNIMQLPDAGHRRPLTDTSNAMEGLQHRQAAGSGAPGPTSSDLGGAVSPVEPMYSSGPSGAGASPLESSPARAAALNEAPQHDLDAFSPLDNRLMLRSSAAPVPDFLQHGRAGAGQQYYMRRPADSLRAPPVLPPSHPTSALAPLPAFGEQHDGFFMQSFLMAYQYLHARGLLSLVWP